LCVLVYAFMYFYLYFYVYMGQVPEIKLMMMTMMKAKSTKATLIISGKLISAILLKAKFSNNSLSAGLSWIAVKVGDLAITNLIRFDSKQFATQNS